ncbi:putative reverse transcriptase domain-containing protein [Helianthus annuus]|uniref:Reverse transcriptase domain-containing protein n=1 Tax=Helianthus annuus TaxID=4232 RepID=A0A9K3I8K9_HELAN|nr:putative reverse transcriptase domain-containing protein [Helianthus annuus]KAJ0527019.1 putative reverse transcriptase domain-containing protein [Helianthus annuus]KAJ0535609.1 putative reverse transcriptase domain-containing protein [Helianthus annuus]KAJ0543413.1 putative reverse transcriptase domain-containing protein [Helianthus annuus]KAJ0708471.1 putative reverse transcriptase domain-containing protein [Helianthus annuus]
MARTLVLVNGSPTCEFVCSRGLGQGDPISSYLFILAMEGLTCVMEKACENDIFKGLKISRDGPILSHFLFADDVLFIGEWSTLNALMLKRILRCFHLVSRLKINLQSVVFTAWALVNQSCLIWRSALDARWVLFYSFISKSRLGII